MSKTAYQAYSQAEQAKKNILTYGLTHDEYEIVKKSIPSKDIDLLCCDGEFTDIIVNSFIAVIINPDKLMSADTELLSGFYEDFCGMYTEKIIFTKKHTQIAEIAPSVKYTAFANKEEMEYKLKYILLEASRKDKKIENYSEIIAQTIRVLSEIKRNPGITTAQLAKIIERNTRTVLRYINTLGCAGEMIDYDNKTHGWSLMGNKSILLGDFD